MQFLLGVNSCGADQGCGFRSRSHARGRAEGRWANTRTATSSDLRQFLDRAGIGRFFAWVVTSVDAGFRKPAPQFFDFALRECGLARDEVLLVGNQLNTDIAGGQSYGIRTVWLSGSAYRSTDETLTPQDVRYAHTIHTLRLLPSLLKSLSSRK